MNVHALLDRASVHLGAPFFPPYFCDDTDSASFTDHLAGASLDVPRLDHEAWHDIPVNTLIGPLSARLWVARLKGPSSPTLIFHHGSNENPPETIFRHVLFRAYPPFDANLIFVQAPFHGSLRRYTRALRKLSAWMAMCAVGVRIIEGAVESLRALGHRRIVVSGISLGGFAANRHHLHFDTADLYAPLLAGGAMGDLMFDTVYRSFLSQRALRDEARIRALLNFQYELAKKDNHNVFPLLARYDEVVLYEREKRSFGDQPVAVVNKSHVTAALSFGELRRHLRRCLELSPAKA